MKEEAYKNREIDEKFQDIKENLALILAQTTKHNGRLTRVERVLLVFGTAIMILLITNGSSLVEFAKLIIK